MGFKDDERECECNYYWSITALNGKEAITIVSNIYYIEQKN